MRTPFKHYVVMFSGGAASWAGARRLLDQGAVGEVTLLFADTRMEDEDLYRFLKDASKNLGLPVQMIAEGRDPWKVFFDVKFIGNTWVDPCSRVLKRDLLRKWLDQHCDPRVTVVVLGFDAEESYRLERSLRYWAPWSVVAPLCEEPAVSKDEVMEWLVAAGIQPPRLYALGFKHNNCGGFCIKAGHAQFLLLLKHFPDRYRWHEEQEERFRLTFGYQRAILKDRRGGQVRPLTLREFRERNERGEEADAFGGVDCACFSPADEELQ